MIDRAGPVCESYSSVICEIPVNLYPVRFKFIIIKKSTGASGYAQRIRCTVRTTGACFNCTGIIDSHIPLDNETQPSCIPVINTECSLFYVQVSVKRDIAHKCNSTGSSYRQIIVGCLGCCTGAVG